MLLKERTIGNVVTSSLSLYKEDTIGISVKNALRFNALGPRSDGTISIEPIKGIGSATFTRDDSANNGIYVRDFENNYRKVADGEARFQGARRVENACVYSNDPDSRTNQFVANTVYTDTGEHELSYNNANSSYYYKQDVPAGTFFTDTKSYEFVLSVEIKLGTYAGSPLGIRALCGSDSNTAIVTTLSTTEYTRVYVTLTTNEVNASPISLGFDNRASTIAGVDTTTGTFYVRNFQIELVSGQTITAPSEYIPTTSSAVSKYFWRTNGNTVASNIVTEAVGLDLHPTSYKSGAKVFDRYNKWAATTAYAVGDRIIPATGSGPSGGNGYYYECVKAGTSGSSEPTFETNTDYAVLTDPDLNDRSAWIISGEDDPDHKLIFSNGKMQYLSTTTSPILVASEASVLTIGKSYYIRSVITDHVSGSIKTDSFSVSKVLGDDVGVFENYGVASSTIFSLTRNSTNVDITADSIHVYEITDDNGALWVCKGYYTILGYIAESARTNSIINSYDLTTWTQTGTAVSALDAVGIDGVVNKATTLTDDDGAAYELVSYPNITITNDANTHLKQHWIKKDADVSRFPSFRLALSGGTAQVRHDHLNTSTGELTNISTTGTTSAWVEDHGDWWRIVQTVTNNTSGNVALESNAYPASGTVAGTVSVAATGSCIVGHAQVELNTSVPSSPIETTGTVETRNADVLYYNSAFENDAEGLAVSSVWLTENSLGNLSGNPLILSSAEGGTDSYIYIQQAVNGRTNSWDGTTVGNDTNVYSDNFSQRRGTRWNGSVKQSAGAGGSAGAEGVYDGAFTFNNNHFYVAGDPKGSVGVSDVLVYNKDLGTARLEAMTAYD